MTGRIYLSTTIPYVNARPHLGFALELVQADVLARHARQRGAQVWFQTGTDDNSLKNVLAAQAEGVPVPDLVRRHAAEFAGLRDPLALSFDDFIQTGSDPRHRPAVERIWRACAARGDLYRRAYQGLYCVGCEQFYRPADLADGRCPEHGTEPEAVSEENWFFRLSKYGGALHDLISSGRLRVEPASRRNEVLAFIAAGLEDFSVSRSTRRAHGWGIPVPGDPGQVMYVWFDALGNYISSLGYGTGAPGYERWWTGSDRRVHLLGKGVLRFHAVYWPAMLLSAGEPLPTDVLVHDYLTIDGRKISKSGGGTADPVELVREFGTDAVRWWLLREVPRVGDADFTTGRLVERANADLAGGVGNLVSRTVAMVHRYRGGVVPGGSYPGGLVSGGGQVSAGPPGSGPAGTGPAVAYLAVADPAATELAEACLRAPDLVRAALDDYDFRAATGAVWRIVDAANRYIEQATPWQLAKAERGGGVAPGVRETERGGGVAAVAREFEGGGVATVVQEARGARGGGAEAANDGGAAAARRKAEHGGDAEAARGGDTGAGARLDVVLATAIAACRCLATLLVPFVPATAARVAAQCGPDILPAADPVFARLG
jgi:methionyl-tRNA synthetase